MSDHTTPMPDDPRILDLLAERAATGLDAEAQAELDRLLTDLPGMSPDELERASAAAASAFAVSDDEEMPEFLRERCIGAAAAILRTDQPQPEPAEPPAPIPMPRDRSNGGPLAQLGWLAAAACLTVAVIGWLPTQAPQPGNPWIGTTSNQQTLAEYRADFIQSSADIVTWRWGAWGEEYKGVEGDVVWDPATNRGFMMFRGLPANDPNRERYQLWIVDQARGTPLEVPPVDGGVFDITEEEGEFVVPFTARLDVGEVFGFGVTLEGPEGVVVSDRERPVVIATSAGPST